MFNDLVFNNEKPRYQQIYDYTKQIIHSGMLLKYCKLPSTRELSEILKVSRNSIIFPQ